MWYASWKEIALKAKLNAADTSLTANVDVWITAGRLYFVSDTQEEWIDFTWVAASGSNFTYSWLTRWLSQTADPATAWTWLTWLAGNKWVIVAMHDNLINKQESWIQKDATKIQFWSTSSYIYSSDTWTNLKFKDWSNAEITLSTIAAAAWADTKVWVTVSDTTTATLDTKLTAWDWLTKTVINPAWAEVLDLDIDTTDTTIFVKTSSWAWDENKVPICNASWNINAFVTWSQVTLVAWEAITAWEAVRNWRWSFSFSEQQLSDDTQFAQGGNTVATVISFTADSDFTLDTVEMYWEWQSLPAIIELYITDASDTILATSDTHSYWTVSPTKFTHTFTAPPSLDRDTTYKIRSHTTTVDQFNYRALTAGSLWYFDASFSWTETDTKVWLTRATDTAQISLVWYADEAVAADANVLINVTWLELNQTWLTVW